MSFSKKHSLLFGLLAMIALIPPQVREIWAQAGVGIAAWSIETVRSWTPPTSSPGSPASNPLALTLLSSGGSTIPAFAFSDGGVMRFSLRSGSGASLWALEDPLARTTYTLLKDISLVTDSTGITHMSYYSDAIIDSGALPGLIYTTRSAAGTWATKPVLVDGGTSTVNAGEFASLLLDSRPSPCLSYRKNSSSNTLHRKCRTSTGWPTSSTALTTDAIFSYTGSAISGSTSHYIFTTADRSGENRLLNHLRRVGTTSTTATWNYMPADTTTDDLHFKDIVVDSSGQSHIVMYNPFMTDVFYAIRPADDTSTDLSTLQIDGGGRAGPDVGRHISLAVCPSTSPIGDSLHVAYYDQTNQALKYARCLRSCGTESSWATSFVDPATPAASPAIVNRGEFTQIGCDSSGIIHIGYYDRSASSLKYANNANQCGNALVETGEVCDDGNRTNCDGCRADCGASETGCGDGFVCGTEQCDTGASRSNTLADACRTDCSNPRCGDGVIDTGETCDDGGVVSSDGCSATCQTEAGGGAICGNGTVETGESCDDGNTDNCSGACNADCTAPITITGCGDGTLCSPEECDDRNATAGDGCSATCRNEPRTGACGDGTLDAGEVCDDSNQMDCDGCHGDCLGSETGCGDRFVCGAEACDDGNMVSADGCSAVCQNEVDPSCGDNIPQVGEECDDGNTATGDGCDANCARELLARCGDGTCNGTEACGTCPGDCGQCATVTCGNSLKEGEEECDDGNMNSGDGCSPTCRNEASALSPDVRPVSPAIGTTGAQPADGTAGTEPTPPGQKGARGARGGGFSCALIR